MSALAPTRARMLSMKIKNSADIVIPTTMQPHIQKEQTFFAYSVRPSPKAREITEVPPMPKTVPTAIKIRNTGVASDTAANKMSLWVCPIKNVSARF